MKFNSFVINFLCLLFVVACNTGPYLKTNAVDAFDLPLDASLNIEVDRDIPAKVDPIFVDFITISQINIIIKYIINIGNFDFKVFY